MENAHRHNKSGWGKVLKVAGISLAVVVSLAVVGVIALTLWLTPDRLTRLVNEKASELLNADVKASNIRFTLWSTFPHLDLELDSINVRSRNFDSIPPSLRARLPKDADFLVSTSKMHGGINILRLLAGEIWLRDVKVDSLRVNLVDATDSLNNYDIVATSGAGKVPYFNIDTLRIDRGGLIGYTSIPSDSRATLNLQKASLVPTKSRDDYRLAFAGDVSATSDGLTVLDHFPIGLDGDIRLRFKPFGVSASDYQVSLGSIDGSMSMDVNLGDNARLNRFNYRLLDFTLSDLYELMPPGSYPELKKLTANVSVDCTARLTTPYDFSSAFLPSIEVDFSVPRGEIDYSLSDNRRYAIRDVKVRGRLVYDGRNPGLSYVEIPEFLVEGCGARVTASGRVDDLTGKPTVSAKVNGNVNLAQAAAFIRELKPYRPAGEVDFSADMRFRLADNTIYGHLMDLKAESPHASMAIDGYLLSLDGVSATGILTPDRKGAHIRKFDIRLDLKRAGLARGDRHYSLKNATVEFDGERNARQIKTADYAVPANWESDVRSLAFAAHTPQYVRVDVADRTRTLMEDWSPRLGLKIATARIALKKEGIPATLSNVALTSTFDSVALHQADLQAGRSGGRISARITNLRQFLASHTPAPLNLDLNLDLDTIQFNQLAHAFYAQSPGKESASKKETSDTQALATADEVPVTYIVPRNLHVNLHASAAQTRYINLHLYNLLTDITVADGNASVDRLHIDADFGHADMNLQYLTSDLQNMCINADLGINDINVVNFFKNFHSLLEAMPQMKNLSGMLSADLKGRVRIFPTMDLMMPSLWADARLKGWDLVIHQNSFIRHVTDMLLIPNNEDLQIKNMDIHAGVHSNLLEVFPFMFEVEKYKLCLGGLNNFNGDLYYHIGVEDWPLKFPFGINVKGTYSHPELRFGGKGWHDSNGALITGGIEDFDRVNLVSEARKYMHKFVDTAATYQGD